MVANQLYIDECLQQSTELYSSRLLDKALVTASEALQLSEEESYLEGMIAAHLLLGNIHNTLGYYSGEFSSFQNAIDHFEQADRMNQINLKPNISKEVARGFALVYQNQNDFDQALQYFKEASEYSEAGNLEEEILDLCALSQLYILQNDFDQALDYANQARDLVEQKAKDNELLFIEVCHQLAQIYIKKQQKYDKILKYSQALLEYSRREKEIEKELKALNNIAIAHGVKSDFKSAMQTAFGNIWLSRL